MAGKKSKNPMDIEPMPTEEEFDLDENTSFEEEEEESEDRGIDEILGDATLGRAAGDLDNWGSSDYEDN